MARTGRYPCIKCGQTGSWFPGRRCTPCIQKDGPVITSPTTGGGARGPVPGFPTMFEKSRRILEKNLKRLENEMSRKDPATKQPVHGWNPAHAEASTVLTNSLEKLQKSEERWAKAQKDAAEGMSEHELKQFLIDQVDELPLQEAAELVMAMSKKLNARRGAA